MTNGRFTRKAAGAVASLALIGGAVAVTAGPAAAADIGFEIENGSLEQTLGDISLGSATYSIDAQIVNTSTAVVLGVEDTREGSLGWSMYLKSSALLHSNGIPADDIAASQVSVGMGNVTAADGPVVPGEDGALDSSRLVLSAANTKGLGVTSADLNFGVAVPAKAPVGTYSGTVTLDNTPIP